MRRKRAEVKKVYVSKSCVGNIEETELDFVLDEEFNAFDEDDERCLIEINRAPLPKVDTEPINIDTLMNDLEQLKSKGATHVQMFYHTDHLGYEISGIKIELADEELIERYEAHQASQAVLREEYNRVSAELRKLAKLID